MKHIRRINFNKELRNEDIAQNKIRTGSNCKNCGVNNVFNSSILAMIYPEGFSYWYTSMGAQNLMSKKRK